MRLYRRAEEARRGYPEPLLNSAYILISELDRVRGGWLWVFRHLAPALLRSGACRPS